VIEPMEKSQQGKGPLLQWLYIAGIFGLGGVFASSLLDGRTTAAVLAVIAIAALFSGPAIGVCVAALAALLGAWLVAVLALFTAMSLWLRTLVVRMPRRQRPPALDALTSSLHAMPDDLLYAVRLRAGSAPLTTWHLVKAARLAKPRQWNELVGADPGAGAWDGPVFAPDERTGAVTMFFAEAVGLASEIAARQQRQVDPDVLAVAASAIPLSAAEQWSPNLERNTKRVLNVQLEDLVEALAAYAGTEAGRDIERRAQIGHWGRGLKIEDRAYLFGLRRTQLPALLRKGLSE
jgi:hypothetical protein